MVAFFGARAAAEAALRLEKMGKDNQLSGAPEVLAELDQHIDQILSSLPDLIGKVSV
jgi:hypothetical protein